MNKDNVYILDSPEYVFAYAHILPFHKGKCNRFHGHSGMVKVSVFGSKRNEFVVDFKILKKEIEKIVDELDHKFIVGRLEAKLVESEGMDLITVIPDGFRSITLFEKELIILEGNSTAEDISEFILDKVIKEFIIKYGYGNVKKVGVEFGEGPKNRIYLEKEINI